MIGVMPMPPAMNRKSCARCGRAEVVDRRRHHQLVAGFGVVDEVGGAAAAVGFALDRDQIAVALGRIVAQRIFAQQSVLRPDRDMRAGGKFRQRLASAIAKFEQMDAVGNSVVARHAQRQHRLLVRCAHSYQGSIIHTRASEGVMRCSTSGEFMPPRQEGSSHLNLPDRSKIEARTLPDAFSARRC